VKSVPSKAWIHTLKLAGAALVLATTACASTQQSAHQKLGFASEMHVRMPMTHNAVRDVMVDSGR
jgi:hypothetical protein